ncbi:MAG: toxin [Deltaproteobacteria bacterium HGW-Deltaproteobacteria-10]|nr:MAG: toxin [Deltaproteobacteria bacterium HGW-Deltaproteobacteria-10]
MKKFKWDEEKNKLLKKERGVSFEEILNSTFLGAEKHQTRNNQIVLLFEHEKYVWVVPCVAGDKFIFLKTMFPSRKYTKMLKAKKVQNEESKIIKRRKRN